MYKDRLLYIETFSTIEDKEIVSVLCAWLCGGKNANDEFYVIKELVECTMGGNPLEYVKCFDKEITKEEDYRCLYGLLSIQDFYGLISTLKRVYHLGTLEQAFIQQFKDVYAHDTLARLLGGCSGFPTRQSSSVFFRYNLLFCWLTWELKIWRNADESCGLIPMDDFMFQRAKDYGYIDKRNNSNSLKDAIEITRKAKEKYGKNFYILYDELATE